MKICIINSLKRRNNARSNLVHGLTIGLSQIGQSFEMINDKEELVLDPSWIPDDCTNVIIPYWISRKIFEINIRDIKKHRSDIVIGVYTGTSPFWDGCPWVYYRPTSKMLEPIGLSSIERENYESIDNYFVVSPREDCNPKNQTTVGMGLFADLKPENKCPDPCIVIDYLKPGWDEKEYEECVRAVGDICSRIPSLRVYILGSNDVAPKFIPKANAMTIPHSYVQWSELVNLWKASWAFICFNESFGYPIVENMACGTKVFSAPSSEIPSCHKIESIHNLEYHIRQWMTCPDKDARAKNISDVFKLSNPEFVSWSDTASEIVKAWS